MGTYNTLCIFRLQSTAVHVSAKGKKVIQQMVNGEKVSHESSGLSKRVE